MTRTGVSNGPVPAAVGRKGHRLSIVTEGMGRKVEEVKVGTESDFVWGDFVLWLCVSCNLWF